MCQESLTAKQSQYVCNVFICGQFRLGLHPDCKLKFFWLCPRRERKKRHFLFKPFLASKRITLNRDASHSSHHWRWRWCYLPKKRSFLMLALNVRFPMCFLAPTASVHICACVCCTDWKDTLGCPGTRTSDVSSSLGWFTPALCVCPLLFSPLYS